MTSQLVPTTRTQYEALVTSSSSPGGGADPSFQTDPSRQTDPSFRQPDQAFSSHQADPRSPAGADSSTHLPDLGVFPSEQDFEGSTLPSSSTFGTAVSVPAITFGSTSASVLTSLTGDQAPTQGKGSQPVTSSSVDPVSGAVAAGAEGGIFETSLGVPNASSAPSSSSGDFHSQHKLPGAFDRGQPKSPASFERASDRASGGGSGFPAKEGKTRDEIVSSSGQMIGGVDMDGGGMICSGGSATDPRSAASASDVVVLAQRYSWVEPCGRPTSPPADFNPRLHGHQVVEVMCSVAPDESLGLMIRGGVEYGLGIFITGVDVGSAADRCGIKVGDQVLEVNNECFLSVTHDTAVSALKYSRGLRLKLRRVGKLPRSCTVFSRRPFHSKESVSASAESMEATLAMIHEKSERMLPPMQHRALLRLVADYAAGRCPVDRLLDVAQQLLDTESKRGLLTELREVVRREDQGKFDALIFPSYSSHLADDSLLSRQKRKKGGRDHEDVGYYSRYYEPSAWSRSYDESPLLPTQHSLYYGPRAARYNMMSDGFTEESLMKDITRGLRDIVKTPSEDSGVELGSSYGLFGPREFNKQYYDRKRLRARLLENYPFSREDFDLDLAVPHSRGDASQRYDDSRYHTPASRLRHPLMRDEFSDLQLEHRERYLPRHPYEHPVTSRHHLEESHHLHLGTSSSPPLPPTLAAHRDAVSLPSRAFAPDNSLLSKEE